MKKYYLWFFCVVSFGSPFQLVFAQEVIPDEFAFVAVDATESYEFVKTCVPSISESSFNQSIRESGDKKSVFTWPADKTKPFLNITKGRVYCIKMSPQKNPVLPLSVFDDTINFADMPKDEVRKLRTDLSKQLSLVGAATALVVNDKGNAYQISYLFSSDLPGKFYYHAGFLRKGEFDEANFRSVYKSSGGITLTGRGQPSEHYKPFFW